MKPIALVDVIQSCSSKSALRSEIACLVLDLSPDLTFLK